MFITVVIAALLLAGILGLVAGTRIKPKPEASRSERDDTIALRRFAIWAGAALTVIGVAVGFFSTFTVIQGYEVGVPVAFGNVGSSMGPGAHFVAPWTSVETYPTRPLTVPDITIKARTSQGGQFTVTVGGRWSATRVGARELYFQVRTGDEDQITEKVVDKALGQAVQNVYSGLDNASAINDRAGVEQLLLTELQKQLNQFGITANNIFLREVEPDAATAATIAQLTAQQQATKVAIASQQTATEQAKAQKITADGLKSAADTLPPNLTPTQVQVLCMQVWERQVAAATAKGITVYTTPCGTSPQAIAK